MNHDFLTEGIRKFLGRQFPTMKSVGNHESLLKNGLIDSLGILEVVGFIESEFGIAVSDDDLVPENFDSVQSIADFVYVKTNGAALG